MPIPHELCVVPQIVLETRPNLTPQVFRLNVQPVAQVPGPDPGQVVKLAKEEAD